MGKRLFMDSRKIEICDLYFKDKASQRKIAKQMGCSQPTIGKVIKEKRYKARDHSECQRGSCNPYWKGGCWVKQSGYVMVYNPSHPHHHLYCGSRGYIQEHRLMMEKHLGRFLKPEEIVHHINENKIDNRIENLRLLKNHGEHIKIHGFGKTVGRGR